MVKYVEKVWGKEQIICNNDFYCGKILHLKKGFQCSLHRHVLKDETLFSIRSSPLFFGIGETDDILAVVSIANSDAEVGIGKLGDILGDSKSFKVELRHVNEGSHTGSIMIYEIKRNLIGWEESRSLKTSVSFSVDVSMEAI